MSSKTCPKRRLSVASVTVSSWQSRLVAGTSGEEWSARRRRVEKRERGGWDSRIARKQDEELLPELSKIEQDADAVRFGVVEEVEVEREDGQVGVGVV